MFKRLLLEDSAALFTVAAFITAFSIYLAITWRALRMKRPQLARFEQLPFEVDTPSAVGAQTRCALASSAHEGRSKSAPLQSSA